MKLNNILKILSITFVLISNTLASAQADITAPLSEEEVASLEGVRAIVPTDISMEKINSLFAGPDDINGHSWSLEGYSPDDLREIMSRDFVVQTLSQDTDQFICTPFVVDFEGKLRIEVIVRDLVAAFVTDEKGVERLDLSQTPHTSLFLETQLSAEELKLPIIRRFQSPLTFEEMTRITRKADKEKVLRGDTPPLPCNDKHFFEVEYPKLMIMAHLLRDPEEKKDTLRMFQELHASYLSNHHADL